MLQLPNPRSFVWFLLICSRRGGATATALTLDTAVDESRKKMADRVARSPARLRSRDGKLCYYRRLEYDFLVFCLTSFFSSFPPPLSRYVSLLGVASSVQQSSATLQQVTCSCVIFVLWLPPLRIPFVVFVLGQQLSLQKTLLFNTLAGFFPGDVKKCPLLSQRAIGLFSRGI